MPTLVDSLILELNLDPTKFEAGQKKVREAAKKTKDELEDNAKKISASGEKASEFFSLLRKEAIGLFAVLAGGTELKHWIENIVTLDTATGRMSRTMGMSATELARWRTAARLWGSDANAITGTLQALENAVQTFNLTGHSAMQGILTQLGIGLNGPNGQVKTSAELLLDLADKLSKMNPRSAAGIMGQLGIPVDQATLNAMLKGRGEIMRLLSEAQKVNPISQGDIDNAMKLTDAWNHLAIAIEGFTRRFVEPLIGVLNKLSAIFNEATNRQSHDIRSPGLPSWWSNFVHGLKMRGSGGNGSGFSPPFSFPNARPPSSIPGIPDDPTNQNFNQRFSPVWPQSLRQKQGANIPSGLWAAAMAIQNDVPGVTRFTAGMDAYHKLIPGSRHNRGLALDFTLDDPRMAAAVAALLAQKVGPNGSVINEYANPSAGATGGHIHLQFNDPGSAGRFLDQLQKNPGYLGSGAGGKQGNVVTNHIKVGDLHLPNATDAKGIAAGLGGAIDRHLMTASFNYGLA